MRHPLPSVLTAAVLCSAPAYAAQTLNAGGGAVGSGLRVVVGENTQLQIIREGAGQLYSPNAVPPSNSIFNGMYLAQGAQVTGPSSGTTGLVTGASIWTNVSQGSVLGTGSVTDPYLVTTVVSNPQGITLSTTVQYASADEYLVVSTTITAPVTNTEPLKLYHLMDTYFAGSDSGPAYFDDALDPSVVGVTRNGSYEAFVELTDPWTRYHSAGYAEQFRQITNGGDLDNLLDTNSVDNGIGVQWDLGVVTGSVTITYGLAFTEVNFNQLDRDSDGVLDLIETFTADTDQDTILDFQDNDDDNDGILTVNEDANADGRPANDDADGDGIADYLEADADNDGLDDRMETATDPYDADTDDDGLNDGEELIVWDTDPRVPDSDGDGLSDGEEVALGTDPALADSDGGCTDDLTEINDGTDPLTLGDDRDDADGDGVCDPFDVCLGADATGDLDFDGVCADSELCLVDADFDGAPVLAYLVPADEACDDAGEVDPAAGAGVDCDDGDPSIFPGADEVPGDGIDNDCDGLQACYVDLDLDAFGSSDTQDVPFLGSCDLLGEALSATGGDCDDTSDAINPSATEIPNDTIDQDCDGDDLGRACFVNADGDGFRTELTVVSDDEDCDDAGESDAAVASGDCDDAQASVYPGAPETPNDTIDQDCDGDDLGRACFVNADGDGFRTELTALSDDEDCTDAGEADATLVSGDCDDAQASIYPGAVETPNDGVDQDCDGDDLGRTCFVNADGDRFRTELTALSDDEDCADAGEADATLALGDCDDAQASVYPGAPETPNDGVDQDCDGDDLGRSCFVNADGDGFRTDLSTLSDDEDCDDAGEAGAAVASGDCDDAQASVYPGALETPNDTIDQDCDGDDLGRSCFVNADGDGFRTDLSTLSDDEDCDDAGEAGAAVASGDCDDSSAAIFPGAVDVPGDGIDQDCEAGDTTLWCYVDGDDDGFRTGALLASADADCADAGEATEGEPDGDCDDASATAFPGATDAAGDGVDSDCDGAEDCYADADDDGWRTDELVASTNPTCDDAGEAYAADPSVDCDDTNGAIYPGAAEALSDGVDQDCNGDDSTIDCAVDADGDGFRAVATVASVDADCADPGEADMLADADCDDDAAAVFPGAAELPADGLDQDCDGGELCYIDADDDGLRPPEGATVSSPDLACDGEFEAVEADPAVDCDDSLADADGDGVSDLEELGAGTEACEPDTDGDGLSDGEELEVYGTDPLTADSDGGGAVDGDEVVAGTDPLDAADDNAGEDTGGDKDPGTGPSGCDCDHSAPMRPWAGLVLALGALIRRRR